MSKVWLQQLAEINLQCLGQIDFEQLTQYLETLKPESIYLKFRWLQLKITWRQKTKSCGQHTQQHTGQCVCVSLQ